MTAHGVSRSAGRRATAGLLALVGATVAGCIALDLAGARRANRAVAQFAHLSGNVSTQAPSEHPLVVLIVRIDCADWRQARAVIESLPKPLPAVPPPELVALREEGHWQLVAHVVRERPGFWFTRVAPGCYGVGAFEDVDEDGRYRDEPALPVGNPTRIFEVAAGDRREGVDLLIPPDGRLAIDAADPVALQVRDLKVRGQGEQLFASLDAVAVEGQVAELSDPRFGAENGRLGYFDFMRFEWTVGPGIYFLEEFEPDKIPVLFVHGALGTPRDFGALIDGLDRARYQPWLFFYPSGVRLSAVSEFLSQLVTRLRLRLRVDELVVVAHSMGGLVARSFILKHHEEARQDPVKLFVAISTPWGGVRSAERGVARSPIVVPSWRDIATDSEFLDDIFFVRSEKGSEPRPLPRGLAFHLLFGVRDRTISLASAARWEAVREAADRWPLAYDHVDILSSPEARTLLGEILERELGD